jgi:hypothetical protein
MINLTLLKELIVELEKNLPKNTIDQNKSFIEISKCIGLLNGVITEATILSTELAYNYKQAEQKVIKKDTN